MGAAHVLIAAFCPRRMRMDLDVAGIDQEPFKIGRGHEVLESLFPDAFVAPADQAPVRIAPSAVIRRQLTPRRPGAQNPKHRVNKSSVIPGLAAPNSFPSR